MISAKLAVLMTAAMIVVSVTAPVLVEAQTVVNTTRSNIKTASIAQEQEACSNDAEVEIDDEDGIDIGGENEAEVEQANVCDVDQSQTAANVGTIEDNSRNEFRHETVRAIIRNLPA